MGLMLAVELNSAALAKQVVARMLERRILINRTSETVLRFLPPFVMRPRARRYLAVSALDDSADVKMANQEVCASKDGFIQTEGGSRMGSKAASSRMTKQHSRQWMGKRICLALATVTPGRP